MAAKRKSSHSHSASRQSDEVARSHDTHHHQKRQKSSDAEDGDELSPTQISTDADSGRGWQTVTAKRPKSDGRRSLNGSHDRPVLRVHQNYQGVVNLKNVRELALYVLADEVAPNWLAVKNAKSVKKVVTIMIPGLDKELLHQALPDATLDTAQRKDGEVDHDTDQAMSEWFWAGYHPVRGPGDTKMSRVHSPLQAMLLSSNATPPAHSTSPADSREQRTSITNLIHSGEELREAEYPVHPAAFTASADARLESERRSQTGQHSAGGWVDSNVTHPQPVVKPECDDWLSRGLTIYSLDCEMVQTSDDVHSLARISLLEYPNGRVVMDEFVKPDRPITNYHTQYSGITPDILKNVTTTLRDVQRQLLQLLTPSTVLLGHSLDSDLHALKMTHPFVVDTSIIFPHPRGLPLRSSLKYLANKYLKREIQMGGQHGHDSVEDAKAVLDLVKLKCERGLTYGTMEANGESIFRVLTRNGRHSAMVEYGTPERGFGKDATYTIGCQNDDELVDGVLRAVAGDDYFDFEIPPGGADFVWGRLRGLEFARGWVTGGGGSRPTEGCDSEKQGDQLSMHGRLDQALIDLARRLLAGVQRIYQALPRNTLLILVSGTGDVRPVVDLQAQQQRYRKEFKTKKWDELTVKWTDTEEQALKRACEDARAGWAVCTVK